MNLFGLLLVFGGAFLIERAVKNSNPFTVIREVIDKPKELNAILKASEGTWYVKAEPVVKTASPTFENGRAPETALKRIIFSPTHRLEANAADALAALNVAYKQRFGKNLSINSAYRSYDAQEELRKALGSKAALPGKSKHGLGIAVDLGGGVNRFGTREHEWMKVNASQFGWTQPSWAAKNGSSPEPWHWEYGA